MPSLCHRRVALAAAIMAPLCASPASAIETRPELPIDTMKAMADTCVAMAQVEGWRMHVAIVDVDGNLRYYARMDGSALMPQEIAIAKATTSAKFPVPTGQLGGMAFPEGRVTPFAFIPGIVMFAGGLPILTAGGSHLGGIGVSGDSAENDEACAQAGLDAVAAELQ